jgi:hypothetical protein
MLCFLKFFSPSYNTDQTKSKHPDCAGNWDGGEGGGQKVTKFLYRLLMCGWWTKGLFFKKPDLGFVFPLLYAVPVFPNQVYNKPDNAYKFNHGPTSFYADYTCSFQDFRLAHQKNS